MAWIRQISAAGVVFCVLSAQAQEISARQDLERLVDLAIERNRDLLATRERIKEAEALLRQAGVRPAPTLEVEGATGRPLGTRRNILLATSTGLRRLASERNVRKSPNRPSRSPKPSMRNGYGVSSSKSGHVR